jgi:MoaA/NifB/PqqE/SkfB family radical SAM enzyme
MSDMKRSDPAYHDNLITYLRAMLSRALRSPGELPGLISRTRHLISVAIRGEKLRARKREELGVPVPFLCIFSVTWRCNLNCRGCYAMNYSPGSELSTDEICDVIDQCCRLGVYFFVIAGGEPLLVPGLPERLASFRKAFFLFYTNGTLLERNLELLSNAGNILPVISVEGLEHYTDLRRGRGVAEKVETAMRLLKDNRVPFGFSTMITHANLRDVTSGEWMLRQWERGARFGFFTDYIPFRKNLDESFILTDEDREYKEAELEKRRAEARPPIFNLPADEYRNGQCMAAGKGMIHINANGYVEPCPYSHFAADNIKDKPVSEVLRSGFLRELRELVLSLDNPRKECMLFSNEEEVALIAEKTGASRTEE